MCASGSALSRNEILRTHTWDRKTLALRSLVTSSFSKPREDSPPLPSLPPRSCHLSSSYHRPPPPPTSTADGVRRRTCLSTYKKKKCARKRKDAAAVCVPSRPLYQRVRLLLLARVVPDPRPAARQHSCAAHPPRSHERMMHHPTPRPP